MYEVFLGEEWSRLRVRVQIHRVNLSTLFTLGSDWQYCCRHCRRSSSITRRIHIKPTRWF